MKTEEFTINGAEVLAKVKELVRAGNIRRIIIKGEDGSTLIEIPLTIGAIGVVLALSVMAIAQPIERRFVISRASDISRAGEAP